MTCGRHHQHQRDLGEDEILGLEPDTTSIAAAQQRRGYGDADGGGVSEVMVVVMVADAVRL